MIRLWETQAEWTRFSQELHAWIAYRERADTVGQHRSQLQAVRVLIERALDELRIPLADVPAAGNAVSIATLCRVHDRRLAWLRRVWMFFRDRFDQRDDPALGPVLRAADEVVWSCYSEPHASLTSLSGQATRLAPPLSFVEAATSPEVFPHGLVPGTLRRDVDLEFLRECLHALPFPVVRVPASCATAPWWLVHLGHEVGHVIDEQLFGYPQRAQAVAALHLADGSAEAWTRWSGEVLADVYAVLMHGPWALWALAVAEERADDEMLQERDSYPSPVLRLLVMTHACRRLQCATAPPVDDGPWRSLVSHDAASVQREADGCRVVDALLAQTVRGQTLETLVDHDPRRWRADKALRTWADRLAVRVPGGPSGRPRRVWAREVMAAAVMARAAGEHAPRDFNGAALGASLLALLPAVREPGSRAVTGSSSADLAASGRALALAVMQAEPALP